MTSELSKSVYLLHTVSLLKEIGVIKWYCYNDLAIGMTNQSQIVQTSIITNQC